MEEIINEYGAGILQLVGGSAVFLLWTKLLCLGGILWQVCLAYMNAICG